MNWSHYDRFLLLLCRPTANANVLREARKEAELTDWKEFLPKARVNGLAPLLYQRFRGPFAELDVPSPVLQILKSDYFSNSMRNIEMLARTAELLKGLSKQGVRCVLLKGPHFVEITYGEIGAKRMADVDLLIPQEDLATTKEVLESLEFTSHNIFFDLAQARVGSHLNAACFYRGENPAFEIDVHWHLLSGSWYCPAAERSPITESAFRDASAATVEGAEALLLSAHHMIIYLCLHAIKHDFERLINLVDLSETVAGVSAGAVWERVVEESGRSDLQIPVFVALLMAKRLLDAPVPGWILSRLAPRRSALCARSACAILKHIGPMPGLRGLVYVSMCRSWKEWSASLVRVFFPSRATVAMIYGTDSPESVGLDFYIRRLGRALKSLVGLSANA